MTDQEKARFALSVLMSEQLNIPAASAKIMGEVQDWLQVLVDSPPILKEVLHANDIETT